MNTIAADVTRAALLEALRRRGARLTADGVADFGEPQAERAAVLQGITLHALTGAGLLEVSGEDGQAFLQGQLTNDVRALSATSAQLSTYCTPQGRMLATMVVWRSGPSYQLLLPAELAGAVAARLRKHVLRAKVRIDEVTERYAVLGIGGAGAAEALRASCGSVPEAALDRLVLGADSLVCLRPGLYLLVVPIEAAGACWDRLAARARPAGTQWWEWRMIRAGIPSLCLATQDRFVPQMAGMDALGAISFEKGCYPGQEVVARARYRGQVKRALFRLHAEGPAAAPGTALFDPAQPGPVGTVLNAAPAPAGGSDMLAVILIDGARRGDLRLGAPDGPRLTLDNAL
jgi:hypothetical protein